MLQQSSSNENSELVSGIKRGTPPTDGNSELVGEIKGGTPITDSSSDETRGDKVCSEHVSPCMVCGVGL